MGLNGWSYIMCWSVQFFVSLEFASCVDMWIASYVYCGWWKVFFTPLIRMSPLRLELAVFWHWCKKVWNLTRKDSERINYMLMFTVGLGQSGKKLCGCFPVNGRVFMFMYLCYYSCLCDLYSKKVLWYSQKHNFLYLSLYQSIYLSIIHPSIHPYIHPLYYCMNPETHMINETKKNARQETLPLPNIMHILYLFIQTLLSQTINTLKTNS